MTLVIATLNDKFDDGDAVYRALVTSLNNEAQWMYNNATQQIQVGAFPHTLGAPHCTSMT